MGRISWILSGIIIIFAIGSAFFVLRPDRTTLPTTPTGTGNASVGANGSSSIITYTDSGFDPSPLSIPVGTTVTWNNQSSRALWVEEMGPGGGDCSAAGAATSLNECASIATGGTYSYTFTAPGTISYFNHEHSDDNGTILVQGSAPAAGPLNQDVVPE